MPFDEPPALQEPEPEGMDVMALLLAGIRPTVGLAGLILAFVLALRLMGSIKSAPPAFAGRASLPSGQEGSTNLPSGQSQPLPQDSRAGSLPRPAAPRLELSDPNITAKVVRAWMNEEGGQG
jgi:hypothetical protein